MPCVPDGTFSVILLSYGLISSNINSTSIHFVNYTRFSL